MTVLAAFSRYLGYVAGGAEKSTFALLAERAAFGDDIVVCGIAGPKLAGRSLLEAKVPAGWRVERFASLAALPRFSYVEYLLNRRRVGRWIGAVRADELWTYGIFAPAAAAAFDGPVTFFVRSEADLGVVANHYEGVRRSLKHAYVTAESPAIEAWRADARRAVRRARVIANSRYMAGRASEELGVKAGVLLPSVDVTRIRVRLAARMDAPRSVVFVGDAVWKGLPLVTRLAARMKDVEFRIFSRLESAARRQGNILWEPWTDDESELYRDARLVIVPSQCGEAYGRVAREAWLLGIPVLASRVGGLPEAVDDDASSLVDEFRRVDAWESAVRRALRERQPRELQPA